MLTLFEEIPLQVVQVYKSFIQLSHLTWQASQSPEPFKGKVSKNLGRQGHYSEAFGVPTLLEEVPLQDVQVEGSVIQLLHLT